jgi:hypothetical protein
MITRSFTAADILVHAGILEPITEVRAQEQVIEPEAGVTLPSVPHVVPEGIDPLGGMEMPKPICPTPANELLERCPAFGLDMAHVLSSPSSRKGITAEPGGTEVSWPWH